MIALHIEPPTGEAFARGVPYADDHTVVIVRKPG